MKPLMVILLAAGLMGCQDMAGHKSAAAQALIEACLREANTQGEQAGKLGVACTKLNDWVRQQGWAAQP